MKLGAVPVLLIAALSAAGCAAPQPKMDYSKFIAADPRSILIVPVVNKSVDVNAPDYFLSTLPIVAAERGYYVFPVNLVKRVLEDDGLADAALVHSADPARLGNMFGADAILYATIERWEARYIVLDTEVAVAFDYVIRDGRSGEELWRNRHAKVYSSSSGGQRGSGNPLADLIGMAIVAAITKAVPSYMPLARQANVEAFAYPGRGFPAGPYSPEYRKDLPEAPAPAAPAAAPGTDNVAAAQPPPATAAGADRAAPPPGTAAGTDNSVTAPGAR